MISLRLYNNRIMNKWLECSLSDHLLFHIHNLNYPPTSPAFVTSNSMRYSSGSFVFAEHVKTFLTGNTLKGQRNGWIAMMPRQCAL